MNIQNWFGARCDLHAKLFSTANINKQIARKVGDILVDLAQVYGTHQELRALYEHCKFKLAFSMINSASIELAN